MKRITIFLAAALALLLLSRCGQDEGICVSSTGKTITQDRTPLPYHYIEVYDNINLILNQDTSFTGIKVEAGENLIDGITTDIDQGRLVLRNRNSCNWLRSFEVPVNVYLTFTRLDTLIVHSAGTINFTNDWANDSIFFNVIEGGGQIDLRLNVLKAYLHVDFGTYSLNVAGHSQVTFISNQGYGPLHAEGLSSKFTYIYTYSPNDIFITADIELGVEIKNIGNVYYHGDPAIIYSIITGKGKLIEF